MQQDISVGKMYLVLLFRTLIDELENVGSRFAKLGRLNSAERLRVEFRHTVERADIVLADPIALERTAKEAAYTSSVWRGECTKLGDPVGEHDFDVIAQELEET